MSGVSEYCGGGMGLFANVEGGLASPTQRAKAVSLREMPTSQNRDMGHPVLGQGEVVGAVVWDESYGVAGFVVAGSGDGEIPDGGGGVGLLRMWKAVSLL
ncbi:MAG: hypothetical protein M3Y50_09095 [Acidobacteriota bacterium]|nr:hypothetical protein [Acidobacteriota bacterium]